MKQRADLAPALTFNQTISRSLDDVSCTAESLQKTGFGYDEKGNFGGSFDRAVIRIKQRLEGSDEPVMDGLPTCRLESLAVVLTCRALKVPFNFSTQAAREQEIRRLGRGLEGYRALEDTVSEVSPALHPDIQHFTF